MKMVVSGGDKMNVLKMNILNTVNQNSPVVNKH